MSTSFSTVPYSRRLHTVHTGTYILYAYEWYRGRVRDTACDQTHKVTTISPKTKDPTNGPKDTLLHSPTLSYTLYSPLDVTHTSILGRMVRMVGQQGGDFDPILDEVSDDDDDDAADVNMEEDDDEQHRAPPQPAADAPRGRRQDMDDEPPLEGYQRCVLVIACTDALATSRYGSYCILRKTIRSTSSLSHSLSQQHHYQIQDGPDWTGCIWHRLQGRSNEVGRHCCH